jgi:cell wall-associated NlpC family hydrolase
MPSPALRSRHACLFAALAAGLALTGAPARAAPDEANDPVLRLLTERHLVGTTSGRPLPTSTAASPATLATPAATNDDPTLLRRVQDRASEMVIVALNAVGVRYRRGGNSEAGGFDCSGFTRYVFGNSLGLQLPRRADEQASAPGLVAVPRDDLRPGDLVFFNTLRRTFSHVGIYIGDNRFVHAPSPGGEVRTEDMGFAYWKTRFTGARRAELVAEARPPVAAAAPGVIDPALR